MFRGEEDTTVSETQHMNDVAERDLEQIREELHLCRLELAKVREAYEEMAEGQAKLRRARKRALKEADVLSKALADVLNRETRERARGAWWRAGQGRISRQEWEDVQILRQSSYFRPAWYLRKNLDIARGGVDPALHFLRDGHREGRDPGPKFSVEQYLEEHPEVRGRGQNPLLHFLHGGDGDESSGSS
jgi:hypothetical protein